MSRIYGKVDKLDPKTWPFIRGHEGENIFWKFWYKQRPDELQLMMLRYQRDQKKKQRAQRKKNEKTT